MLNLMLFMPSSGVKSFAVAKLHILVNFGPNFLGNRFRVYLDIYIYLHIFTYTFVIRGISVFQRYATQQFLSMPKNWNFFFIF